MAKKNINSKQGFTIIEVVLVLAIAGLIFLMVFVALPALQRSQRDTARRNDLARVDTSLVQYQTNNQGTNDGTNLPKNSNKYALFSSCVVTVFTILFLLAIVVYSFLCNLFYCFFFLV